MTFPSRLNDQLHKGFLSVLTPKDGLRPVILTDLYFKCMGFKYGSSAELDDSYISCRIRKPGPNQSPEPTYRLSCTTATENLRALLQKHGFPWKCAL